MTSVNKAALLAQKDRDIESQLIKISMNAFPKPKLERAVNIGQKPIYKRVLEGTPEYMAQKMNTDRMLDAQLEKISTNATRDIKTGPPKLVSAVTQEMIDEYKAESLKPLVIDGVSYKYHPVSGIAALALDPFDETQFNILTPEQKDRAYADMADLRLEINGFNEDIALYAVRREEARKRYDKLLPTADTPKRQSLLEKDFEDQIRKIDKATKDCEVNIAKAETDIRQIEHFIENRANDQQLYDAEKYRVNSINRQRLNDATDEFNNLNTGRLNMEQNTNETDTEYLARLQDVGIKPASVEEVEASSDIVNTMRAQKNLEQIISDKGKIGNIVKWMSRIEQFEFNKRFPRIKKKYVEEYGYNNKQITDREIYDFIVEELAQPAPPAPPQARAAAAAPQRAAATPLAPAPATDPLSAMLLRRAPPADEPPSVPWTGRAKKAPIDPTTPPPKTKGGLDLSGLAGVKLKPSKDRGPKLVVEEVSTPQKLSMMDEVKAKMAQRAKSTLSQPADDDSEWDPDESVAVKVKSAPTTQTTKALGPKEIFILDMKNAGLSSVTNKAPKTSEEMVTELMSKNADISVDALQRARMNEKTRSEALDYMSAIISERQKSLTGIGIKKLSKVMPFGKISINPDMLYYKNTLIIRRLKDKKSITGHKNIVVSDDFVDIIFKIINGTPITKTNIKNLSNNEKILYDNLMMQSGLHKTQPHTIDESSQQMKKRVDLIVGEIQAGNSNKSLLQELHSLLNKMSRLNLIPMTQASQFYKSVKNQYF